MNIKRFMNSAILLLLAVFTVLSVRGAFLGAQRAKAFFNSLPMIVFWCSFLLLMIIGFFTYAPLRKGRGLMLIHTGCILVLVGGMYGSGLTHTLLNRFFDKELFARGQMSLHQGQISNHVITESTGDISSLSFSIGLKEAFIEYYDEPLIRLHFNDGDHFDIPLQTGKVFDVPAHDGTIEILRIYKNFKMNQESGKPVPHDSAEPGTNPAYELAFTPKNGTPEPSFVFERFGMHAMPGQTYRAEYVPARMVKDYKSVLQVLKKDQLVKEQTIEVNKPLYYGGYHFYQNTFAYDGFGPISGILIVSTRGVHIVFAGYIIIFVGLILQLWIKPFRRRKSLQIPGGLKSSNSEGKR